MQCGCYLIQNILSFFFGHPNDLVPISSDNRVSTVLYRYIMELFRLNITADDC